MAEDKKFPDPPPGMLPMFIQMKSASRARWSPGRATRERDALTRQRANGHVEGA